MDLGLGSGEFESAERVRVQPNSDRRTTVHSGFGGWPNSYETVQIFEEGFKFLGIAAWLIFWCHYVSSASKPASLEQH